MKKTVIFLALVLTSSFWSCSDFLDETPNKSGSAYIYHMDQLYGLAGNFNLYRAGYQWTDLIFRGDGVEYPPYYVVRTAASGNDYQIWAWDNRYLSTTEGINNTTWTSVWNAVYSYNTVLENMDNVIQTTPSVRKQVEGEALFGRAYFHFIALVQYALWGEDAPGIGYRDNTSPSDIPARETVKYTLDRIYQDLDDAEAALTAAGRTQFELARNFRPTIPAVKALRARIDLYRGNYTSALTNANAALAGYDYLFDFKNDTELHTVYETSNSISVLDPTNSTVVSYLPYRVLTDALAKGAEAQAKHPEFYLPHFSDLYYANRQLPISQSYYALFDHANDERWKRFYDNNYLVQFRIGRSITLPGQTTATPRCFTWEDQQNIPEATRHAYLRYSSSSGSSGKYYLLGLTTAEMYLIKAECLSRAGNTADAATALRTLRRARFTTTAAADAIGGSVQEVLDERAREMTELWRFFDIKRLNGAENANISIHRQVLTDVSDVTSAQNVVIAPNDSRWALPFTFQQILLMGWEQN